VSKKIEDLREHLFETLAALRDTDHPMEIDRAKTIADVAQVIVNSAKVECDYIKLTGAVGSGFIPQLSNDVPKPGQPRLVRGRDTHG
jgi:hypothetical protein